MAFYELTGKKLKVNLSELFEDCSVTLYCNSGVHVEGHKGIMLFSNEEIVFKGKRKEISVYGNHLKLREITDSDAYITGDVNGVNLGRIDGRD